MHLRLLWDLSLCVPTVITLENHYTENSKLSAFSSTFTSLLPEAGLIILLRRHQSACGGIVLLRKKENDMQREGGGHTDIL